jgi:catechol 2,3-dioxygenase-like lactoylglutathione lyase family enzyme
MPDTGAQIATETADPSITSTDLPSRGIHHLALTTEDMHMTTDFLVNIVGMPLVHAMKVPPGVGIGPGNRGNPPYEEIRHYFFDMGNDSLLAYFEIPKGEKRQSDRDDIGGMQHCAFTVTPDQLETLRQRFDDSGVEYDGPVDILPGLVSMYFMDPNGVRMEACCQPEKGNNPNVIGSVLQTKAQARAELLSTGASEGWVAGVTANLPD